MPFQSLGAFSFGRWGHGINTYAMVWEFVSFDEYGHEHTMGFPPLLPTVIQNRLEGTE